MTKKGVDPELQKKFVFSSYRYFTQPSKISKGKHLTVASMYHSGTKKEDIKRVLTNTNGGTVDGFISAYEEGKNKSSDEYVGKSLGSDADVCRSFGSLNKYIV